MDKKTTVPNRAIDVLYDRCNECSEKVKEISQNLEEQQQKKMILDRIKKEVISIQKLCKNF